MSAPPDSLHALHSLTQSGKICNVHAIVSMLAFQYVKVVESTQFLSLKIQQQEVAIQRLVDENSAQEEANRRLTARVHKLEQAQRSHPELYSEYAWLHTFAWEKLRLAAQFTWVPRDVELTCVYLRSYDQCSCDIYVRKCSCDKAIVVWQWLAVFRLQMTSLSAAVSSTSSP